MGSRGSVRLLLVLGVVAGLLALGFIRAVQWAHRPAPTSHPRPTAASAGPPAIDALHSWDAVRARAWAHGDPVALGRLYVAGSRAGDHDVQLLRSYGERGFVVRDLRRQILTVRVLGVTHDRLWLVVTDRLAGGVAVAGEQRIRLPGGAAVTRTLVLRRIAGEWRMASVQRGPP